MMKREERGRGHLCSFPIPVNLFNELDVLLHLGGDEFFFSIQNSLFVSWSWFAISKWQMTLVKVEAEREKTTVSEALDRSTWSVIKLETGKGMNLNVSPLAPRLKFLSVCFLTLRWMDKYDCLVMEASDSCIMVSNQLHYMHVCCTQVTRWLPFRCATPLRRALGERHGSLHLEATTLKLLLGRFLTFIDKKLRRL